MALLLTSTTHATVINLVFHGVGDPPRPLADGERMVWLSTEQFEAVLDAVRGRADVRISFDDGNRSDLEIALPALRRRGLTATFFVLAGMLDDPAHVSAEDVRTLRDEGMTIGNHGMDHVDWRKADDRALERELGTARRRLEAICRRPVRTAAIPFGRYDRRVLAALRRHGYTTVYSSDDGPARADAWLATRNSLRSFYDPADVTRLLTPDLSTRASATRGAKTALKRWR